MAKEVQNTDKSSFSTRLEIRGSNAKIIRTGLDSKMKKETRKTYTSTIEAILVEYFEKKS